MKIRVKEHAEFRPDRMAKVALATTPRAQLDLYCLEPGQSQKPHKHDGSDKVYMVLEGVARFDVDGETLDVGANHAVVCPAGFCLLIFSTGISRFWQFGWIPVDEPLVNQILCPRTALHDIWPVCSTLSKMTSHLSFCWPGCV